MVAMIIALILLLLLVIQLPPVQNFIARQVVGSLNEQLNATISADRVYVSLLKRVKVKGVVITDQRQDTVISATEINIGLRLFPLMKNQFQFGRIQIDDPRLHLVKHTSDSLLNIVTMFQPEQPRPPRKKSGSIPEIQFTRIRINNLDFLLHDRVNDSRLAVELGRLVLRPEMLDIEAQSMQIRTLRITDMDLGIFSPAADTADTADTTEQASASQANVPPKDLLSIIPWTIGVENLELCNNNLDIREQQYGLTGNTQKLLVQQLEADIAGISIDSTGYAAGISSLQGTFNRDTDIRDLSLAATFNNRSAVLSSGRVRLNDSRLFLNARLNYTSSGRLMADPGHAALNVDLRAEAGPGDLAGLLKEKWPLATYPPLLVSGNISGTLDSIRIDSIIGTAGEAIYLRTSGTLNKLLEPEHLSGSVDLEKCDIFRDELYALLPDTLLPEQISLPEEIALEGTVAGNRLQVTSDLSLLTSIGSVFTRAEASMDTVLNREQLQMEISTEAFDLGALLNQSDTLGEVAFAGQLRATSSNFKDPQVTADLNIARAEVFGYSYSDWIFSGDYTNEIIHIQSSMDDPNSSFVLTGEYHFNDSIPDIFLEADIRQLRLKPLHMADSRTDIEMKVSAGLNGLDPATMLGNVQLTRLGFQTDQENYRIDSVQLLFDGPSNYQMLLHQFRVNDTLFVHHIDFRAHLEQRAQEQRAQEQHAQELPAQEQRTLEQHSMEVVYSGLFEHIPGTNGGLIDLDGDGSLLVLPDSLVLGSDFYFSNRSVQDTSGYRIDFSRILSGEGRSSYDLFLTGDDMQVSGTAALITSGETQTIDGKAVVDSLNLALLQPILGDVLQSISGRVSGNLAVTGALTAPDLQGSVTFRNTQFNPGALNTSFLLQEETVALENQRVTFDQLTLRDNLENRAVLNGTIDLDKEADSNFDLTLMASEFQLINKSAAQGNLYFGSVFADLDGRVSGTFENPVIQLNSAFRKRSDFSFVIPGGRTPTGEGIIQFVDADQPDTRQSDSLVQIETVRSRSTNLEVSASAALTDRFTLTIITNPLTGERLQINGDGDLAFELDRSGEMSLIGKYEISKGSYNLQLFDVIKREFTIEPGSFLNWSGEILEANADIAAVYEVNTSLDELMQYGQGTAGTDAVYGSADVEVVMRLTGPLLTPEIEFDIRSKEQGAAIVAALSGLRNNPSELNKQVFSLLVLNRFMGESATAPDPLSYDFSNQSRQSLSSLLSKQLDRFADQYIKKVDLDIEIDSYETGMESEVAARTDVSMDLSTNVFNDRLTLEVGGSLAVEEPGIRGENIEAGDLAGDFRVEYKLSKDGVYRVNVFNKTDYENEIDGEVTKTGVSFIFNKDFTTFRELFRDNRKGGGNEE